MIVAGVITEREGANIHKMIGFLVDITEITEVKNQLEIQNNELIILKDKEQKATNDIAYQILLGQERERNVIAQELHDGVNQLLFAAKIQLQEAKEFDSKMYLNGVSLIEKSIHEIRYIASNQNSFLLHNRSLYEGLNNLILSLPTTKVHFNLKVNNKFLVRLSDNKRIIVFRIIQELIHNILKHSDAKNANIFVKKTPLTISILVTDNGKGIDIAKIKKGNGLINIENKLKILNGFFDLKSKLNKGSMFYINFPVNA
jgi:signal transduction histidine kinase